MKSVNEKEVFNFSTTQLSNYMKEKKSKQVRQEQKGKQIKVKSRVPGGGDFMADLANKLRR